MIKNKIAKLGLLSVFSLWMAGCATPTSYIYKTQTIENVRDYENQKTSVREEKKGSVLTYRINEVKNNESALSLSVKESKKEIKEIITTTSIPVYNEEMQIREGRAYFMTLLGPSDSYLQTSHDLISSNKTKVRDEISEEKKIREELVYENQPARYLLVKVSSQYFGFDENKASPIMTKTDANGVAAAQITRMPSLWYIDENEATKNILPVLKRGIKRNLLDKINLDDTRFRIVNKEYPLNIKTMSEANLAMNLEENLKLIDDEKTFYVNGKEIDISPLCSYIENIIKTDLENRYMRRSVAVQVVAEDLMPLEAEIEFKAINTLSPNEVSVEIERIKNSYLVKGEGLYEEVNVDPYCVISNLDGQKAEIPADGLEILVNVPSEYDITVAKEGYIPAEKRVPFTKTMKGKLPVKMYRLGTPVTIGTGKSTMDVE